MCVSYTGCRSCQQCPLPPKKSDKKQSSTMLQTKQDVLISWMCAFLVKNFVLLVPYDANCVHCFLRWTETDGEMLCCKYASGHSLTLHGSNVYFCCSGFSWLVFISCHTIFMLPVYDCTYLHGWFSFTCDRLWKTWNKLSDFSLVCHLFTSISLCKSFTKCISFLAAMMLQQFLTYIMSLINPTYVIDMEIT